MSDLEQTWGTLVEHLRSDGIQCPPVSEETLAALDEALELPPAWAALFRIGYPRRPVAVDHHSLFPDPGSLAGQIEADPRWPAAWLPLSAGDTQHRLFVRSDAEGVWSAWTGPPAEQGHYDATRAWEDPAQFLRAVILLRDLVDEDPWIHWARGRWLTRGAIDDLAEALGHEGAEKALAAFELGGPHDLESHLEGERSSTALGMGLTGAMTLAIAALLLLPVAAGTPFGLVSLLLVLVGTLPAGLFAWFAVERRRASANLDRLRREHLHEG